MAGDVLEEEMLRRGAEGVPRVQFSSKTGAPLRDPRWCERCGGSRDEHPLMPNDEPGPAPQRDCSGFLPGVYVEREYSDRLLEQLARSHLPERYQNRLEVRSVVANIDMGKLPDVALARIAAGEDVQAVLASIIAQGGEDAEAVKKALPAGTKVGGRHRTTKQAGELVREEEGDSKGDRKGQRTPPGEFLEEL